ncbi:MAG: hemolysin family protein [Serratia inhibens]|uniref:hemolysin family protein n=1 Tax=Serratia inhibens TaxID=2338073 RepID=UPI003C79AF46
MSELAMVLLVVLLLVLVNGLFVAAEFAIIAASRPAMSAKAESGDPIAARVERILSHPVLLDRYVATAQLGITFASLGLGMYGEHQLSLLIESGLFAIGVTGVGSWLTAHAIAVILSLTAMTYLHIVLGEMIPKSLAINHAASAALWVMRPMLVVSVLFHPLVVVLNWVGNRLLGVVGFQRTSAAAHSPEELELLARESQAGGLLGHESARVFHELVDFSDLTAAEAMVPRVMVVGLPFGASYDDIARTLTQRSHTRYPVFEQSMDRIIGTTHIRDLLGALAERRPLSLQDIHETAYLPENATLDDVLAAMHRVRNQMVVVMDEHGGTAGTLTMEDLYAETVGDVEEGVEDIPDIVPLAGHRYRLRGTVRLDTLGDVLGMELEHLDVDTVSGLILSELGRPPRLGDSVIWQSLRFDVIRLHGRGVDEVIAQSWHLKSESNSDSNPIQR